MDKQDEIITIDDFTDKHWAEIHEIARQKLEFNEFQGNQFKCTVSAFLEWLADQPFNVGIEIPNLHGEPPNNLIM